MTHPGHNVGAWPTGCPLPPEDPARLQGPEVGETLIYLYGPERKAHRQSRATVLHRSYVWSPGECRSNGGYRHYDWSVVEVTDPDRKPYTVVVNDTDLEPLPRREYLRERMETGEATFAEMREWDESEADRREELEASVQPGVWQVLFMYADEYEEAEHTPDEYDAQQVMFGTKAEAEAFVRGIEWGDEPKYRSLGITRLA